MKKTPQICRAERHGRETERKRVGHTILMNPPKNWDVIGKNKKNES